MPGSYLASVLRSLGELAMARGDLTDARRRLDESLSREVGDDWASERTVASQATLAKLGNNDRRT